MGSSGNPLAGTTPDERCLLHTDSVRARGSTEVRLSAEISNAGLGVGVAEAVIEDG